MATSEEYAQWIVKNADKKGTHEFDIVAKAYQDSRSKEIEPTEQPKSPLTWGAVPGEAISNFPKSAKQFGEGVVNTVSHPIDTANNLVDMGAGALRNLTPDPLLRANDALNKNLFGMGNEKGVEAQEKASAVGQFYKDRYGSEEGVKQALANDPVGVMSDLSALTAGGGAALTKAGKLPSVASALTKTSNVLNPVSLPKNLLKATGKTAQNLLGATTQTGADAVGQAFKSGATKEPTFIQHLSGDAPFTDTIDLAKKGLNKLRQLRADEYQTTRANVGATPEIIDMADIKQAAQKAAGISKFGDFEIRPSAASIKGKIQEQIDKFDALYQSDPGKYGNPLGMDALKQAIGDIRDRTDFGTPDRKIADKVYNSIKNKIVEKAPEYGKMMKDYEKASSELKDVEKTFSLGEKTGKDTAIRKLQSLTRNNVYTNYGYRQTLADVLKEKGGVDLMPSVSGQAMKPWLPRTLGGQIETIGTLGAAYFDPGILATLPFQSPKVVGNAAYRAGQGYGAVANPIQGLISQLPVKPTAQQLNLISQLGQRQ